MQSYKKYFQVFLERQYFADISAKLVKMTNQLKKQFDNLIKSDRFIDLTLTYDFEEEQPKVRQKEYFKKLFE